MVWNGEVSHGVSALSVPIGRPFSSLLVLETNTPATFSLRELVVDALSTAAISFSRYERYGRRFSCIKQCKHLVVFLFYCLLVIPVGDFAGLDVIEGLVVVISKFPYLLMS